MKNMLCVMLAAIMLLCCGCGKSENTVVDITVPQGEGGFPGGKGEMPAGDFGGFPGGNGEMPEGGFGDFPGSMGEMPEGMPEGMGERPRGGRENGEGSPAQGEGGSGMAGMTMGENQVIGKVQSIAGNYATLLIGKSENGSITYTDEEQSYLLPVGMSIGTGDFTSVTAGMVLRLTFDGDNITAVSIVSR